MTTRDCKKEMSKFAVFNQFPCRKKMIALVAQKFISDVAMDAMQFSRMRQMSSSAGSSEAARKAASLKVTREREVDF